jgi:hypothetical protein
VECEGEGGRNVSQSIDSHLLPTSGPVVAVVWSNDSETPHSSETSDGMQKDWTWAFPARFRRTLNFSRAGIPPTMPGSPPECDIGQPDSAAKFIPQPVVIERERDVVRFRPKVLEGQEATATSPPTFPGRVCNTPRERFSAASLLTAASPPGAGQVFERRLV